jgi:hypothetical protein
MNFIGAFGSFGCALRNLLAMGHGDYKDDNDKFNVNVTSFQSHIKDLLANK